MLEGGAHVPMIAHWLARLHGKVYNDLVDSTDLYTTFTELAGGKLPSDRTMDGVSLGQLLNGKPLNEPKGTGFSFYSGPSGMMKIKNGSFMKMAI